MKKAVSAIFILALVAVASLVGADYSANTEIFEVAQVATTVISGASLAIFGMVKSGPSVSHLEAKAAKELSSYYGKPGYIEPGLVSYAGGSPGSFLDESKRLESYTLELTNANAATRYALLGGGLYNLTGTGGLVATGAFNDANGDAGLTGAGSPQSIEKLIGFSRFNPIRLLGMKFVSTVAAQIELNITVTVENPFSPSGNARNIPLAVHTNEMANKDKVATIDLTRYNVQLDAQTKIQIPVSGSSTLTATLFFGNTLNTAAALNQMAAQALVTA